MKRKLIRLSGRYATALRNHLRRAPGDNSKPALVLGRQAAALGLETRELARMHERAFTTLELSNCTNALTKRAEMFYAEAITPIVETHRAAQQSKIDLHRLNETLDRRTLDAEVFRDQGAADGFPSSARIDSGSTRAPPARTAQ